MSLNICVLVLCFEIATCVKYHAHCFSLFPVVTKPGNCPTFVTPDPPYPCPPPIDMCRHDGDCPGNEKCCRRTFCGGYVCGLPEPGALARRPLMFPVGHVLSPLETGPSVTVTAVISDQTSNARQHDFRNCSLLKPII